MKKILYNSFLTKTKQKGSSFMQTNYTQFRPDLKGVKIIKSYFFENTYHINAKRYDKRPKCCNKKMNIKDYRTVNIKDTEYRSKKVIIHVKKQRYICPCCKKVVTSKLDFVDFNHSISKNVKEEVLNKIKDIKSFKQVSKELKISISSVLRIFDSIVITSKKLDTSVLYMDEFKGNADGEKYQLAIYDRNKKLVTILKNRKSNTIREFFFTLDVKPRIVVTDLFMQFRNIIRSSLGDVEIVADKYHFVRQVEWMIRDLRTRMYNSDIKFKELKKYWKLLATSPSKLSDKQLDVLSRLKKLDLRIENCYGYKEHFYRIMEIDKISEFRSEFEAFIEKLESSEIKESLYLGSTFRNWQKEIENSVKYGINNGFVEGNNNKIKVIKRVSYGIKKFKTLEKLIQLRIS